MESGPGSRGQWPVGRLRARVRARARAGVRAGVSGQWSVGRVRVRMRVGTLTVDSLRSSCRCADSDAERASSV